MNLYNLKYLIKSKDGGICGDDFDERLKTAQLNLDFLVSLSDIIKFHLPFSGTFVGTYAIITMSNDEKYYILKEEYNKLKKHLNEETK